MGIETRLARIEDAEHARLNAAIDAALAGFTDDEVSALTSEIRASFTKENLAYMSDMELKERRGVLMDQSSIADLRAFLNAYTSWLTEHRAGQISAGDAR